MDWIHLAHYRDRWRAVLNNVMNLLVPKRSFLTIWTTVSFSRTLCSVGISSLSTALLWVT
jgi:hypothetical protein